MPAGRPTVYSEKYVESVCEHIASGKSLVSWCQIAGNVSYTTVMRWVEENPEFQQRYVRAREAQADYLAEEIVQIADDGQNDTYVDEDGKQRTDQDVIARSRLRVDARKWYASKLSAKKYGDKVAVGGADDMPPISTTLQVAGLTDDQLRALASIPVQS